MIVDKIENYLKSTGKIFNESVLNDSYLKFKYSVIRQFMQDQASKPGNLYTTMVTKKCARQAAYKFHNFKAEELSPRTKINFFCGDLIELTVLMLARLAGVPIEENNISLQVVMDDTSLTCKPDGLFFDGKEYFNVEIKKMSDYIFDDFKKEGLNDFWGYKSQCMQEIGAWKQKGVQIDKAIFIGIKGLTGNLHEEIINYDESLVRDIFKRAKQVKNSTVDNLPERWYNPIVETYRKKETGRLKLGIECSYCSYHEQCYPDFKLEFSNQKAPIFVK